MECLSGITGVAAAGGVTCVAKESFEYNRGNFLSDRDQRRRAGCHLMGWRIEQSKMWREDVRDLISLTEYKMHIYLIVNVLVLGYTIFLFTEGRLASGTPPVLMVGNIVSIAAAFGFLLMSIWLAMHAAICAQSFEARLRTQLVRLPIPTWEELEATRTYASDFEKIEARQMFRVPYIMGYQEDLLRTNRTLDSANSAEGAAGSAPAVDVTSSSRASPRPNASAPAATATANAPAADQKPVDPWGLEQPGDGFPELGCGLGSDIAKLRHVKLTRQAAIQWQTHDAFSRMALSMGVQQLMLAMSYYILGYLMVEVGVKAPACFAVLGFTFIAAMIVRFDVTLDRGRLLLAQGLLCLGPVSATIGTCAWQVYHSKIAESMLIVAFLAHGLYFALMAAFCNVWRTEMGAWLPVVFRSVVYLDVFSWIRGVNDAPPAQRSANSTESRQDDDQPALRSVNYKDGLPVATCPQDMAPEGIRNDLRDLPGAPDVRRLADASKPRDEEFYNPLMYLPPSADGEADNLDDVKEGTAERLGPGDLPWRVFTSAMVLVCLLWFASAAYAIHGTVTGWSLDLPQKKDLRHRPSWFHKQDEERRQRIKSSEAKKHNHHVQETKGHPVKTTGHPVKTIEWEPWVTDKMAEIPIQPGSGSQMLPRAAFMQKGAGFLGANVTDLSPGLPQLEKIAVSWPSPNMAPKRLTCDGTGRNFVMADRVLMLSGSIDEHSPHLALGEFGCDALLGEGLEDVAVSCDSAHPGCEVLALHRHGRRLAACRWAKAKAQSLVAVGTKSQEAEGEGKVETITETWLENFHERRIAEGGKARSRIEKALSISVSPDCKGDSASSFCAVLGTTHGRVVQIGRRSNGKDLIPTEILHENEDHDITALGSGVVRAFNSQYLGVLQPNEGNIRLLDVGQGGRAAGTLSFPISKPVSSFCAGGGHAYLLTEGPEPELWRLPIPKELKPDVAAA